MKPRNPNHSKSNYVYLVAVHPQVSLQSGPKFVTLGSDVTLPTCQVIGYPAPVVTWRKAFGQLPQGRTYYNNNSVLQISDVRLKVTLIHTSVQRLTFWEMLKEKLN